MATRLATAGHFRDPDLPLAIVRREPQEPVTPHAHDFSELVLITAGHGVHVTDRGEYPIGPGDVFVILGEMAHHFTMLADLHLINVLYHEDELQMPRFDLPNVPGYHALFTIEPQYRAAHEFRSRLHLSTPQLERATTLVERIETEIATREPGYRMAVTALFMQLVVYLSRAYVRSAMPGGEVETVLRAAEALSYVEEHFDQPIRLDELAAMAHMSESSLLRIFRKATGLPPIEYQLHLRIRRACEWLRRTDLPVTEIAFRLGFSDSNYFSRQFRRVMKTSPRAYRHTIGDRRG